MPFCKYCGRHIPESEGDVCENCLKQESQQESIPYPLLLAPPKSVKSKKPMTMFYVIAVALGVILLFFLLGRKIVS